MPSSKSAAMSWSQRVQIDLMMQWHVTRIRGSAESQPLTEHSPNAAHCGSAMLRRAVPKLIRICNIVNTPAKPHGQIECCKLHQSRSRSVTAAVVRSWVGPSVFKRGFAANSGTLLVHFPLAQTGEGAPAVYLSPPLGWALQNAPPGISRRHQRALGMVQARLASGIQRDHVNPDTRTMVAKWLQTTCKYPLPAQHDRMMLHY